MKIKIINLILPITLLSMANLAWADITIARGGYAEANIGFVPNIEGSSDSTWYERWGLNLNVGYKFMPYIAAELGYTTYGTEEESFTGACATDVTSKVMIPFVEAGVDIFGKLGVAIVNSSNDLGLYYGFGGEYAMSPNSLIVVQWAQANNNGPDGNLWLLSVGINFIFGSNFY